VLAVPVEVSVIPDFYPFDFFKQIFSKDLLNSTEECHHIVSRYIRSSK